jgi:hypothetical protein
MDMSFRIIMGCTASYERRNGENDSLAMNFIFRFVTGAVLLAGDSSGYVKKSLLLIRYPMRCGRSWR